MTVELVLHGTIILLVSQIAGYAFFRSINASPEDTARMARWRMSHSACSAGAVFLIALGPVVPHLRLDPLPPVLLVGILVGSTYALCLGTVAAGVFGHRGTEPRPPWPNLLVYVLYIAGALGSTISGLMLLYGVARA